MQLRVDPGALETEAQAMNSLSVQVTECIGRMSQAVAGIESSWSSEDARAFITQMELRRPALMEMAEVLQSFSSMLAQSATAYRTLEANRSAAARLL